MNTNHSLCCILSYRSTIVFTEIAEAQSIMETTPALYNLLKVLKWIFLTYFKFKMTITPLRLHSSVVDKAEHAYKKLIYKLNVIYFSNIW